MPKFYGAVGYIENRETAVDVITEEPIERMYKGDLLKNDRRLDNGVSINDDINISNRISILADAYANNHIHDMRYVKWRGTAWKVALVDASQPPRLILTLGGVYNGETENGA